MHKKNILKWSAVVLLILLGSAFLFFRLLSPIDRTEVNEGKRPRPDVVAWIEKHYGNDHRKKAATTRLAEAYQHILTDPDDDSGSIEKSDVALSCISLAFGTPEEQIDGMYPHEAMERLTFNTKDRAKMYIEYNGRQSGKVFQLYQVKSWDDECEKPFWQ